MPNIQPAAILVAGWVAKTIATDYGSGGNRSQDPLTSEQWA